MKKKYILPLFLVFQIVFLKVLAFFPAFVEQWYSNGLYVYIAKISRTVLGKVPFSVGDLIYSAAIVCAVYWLVKNRKIGWKNLTLSILSFLSVLYFAFHFLWAFNYYRVPLFEKMQIRRDYNEEDLLQFTEKLIVTTNAIHFKITKDKNKKVTVPYSQNEVFMMTQRGYDLLAKQHPYFSYSIPSQKKSLLSLPLTYMGFGGYLNPFTNEAQVNDRLPMYSFPNVVCHEMAHQIGFGSESECNFIGFLAGVSNDDLYFQYSAYATALRYCLGTVAAKEKTLFERLKLKVNPGIIKNYRESEAFWKQYDTVIDKAFHAFYNQYLKSNQQEDGIDSYNKFVDLLINYYRL